MSGILIFTFLKKYVRYKFNPPLTLATARIRTVANKIYIHKIYNRTDGEGHIRVRND